MKLIAALILTIAVGVQVLEASGRWDGGFADANDEAGLVGVVFCIGIGIAVAAAAARPARSRAARVSIAAVVIRSSVGARAAVAPAPTPTRCSSPPTTLRI